jgi:hypothetical protein
MTKLETGRDENSIPHMQKRQVKDLVNDGEIKIEPYVTTQ